MSGRCETCKSWADSEGTDWGTCKRAHSDNGHAADPTSFAVANDAETYHADLSTRFDFGCVQWESATDEAGVPFYPPTRQE